MARCAGVRNTDAVHDYVRAVREATTVPLSVKLTAQTADPLALAEGAFAAGADMLVLMGRFPGLHAGYRNDAADSRIGRRNRRAMGVAVDALLDQPMFQGAAAGNSAARNQRRARRRRRRPGAFERGARRGNSERGCWPAARELWARCSRDWKRTARARGSHGLDQMVGHPLRCGAGSARSRR